MIHDSYGAPVAQAKHMYKVVRESFIKMYTDHDVLESFRDDMKKLSDTKLPDFPARGILDLNEIIKSKYIFS